MAQQIINNGDFANDPDAELTYTSFEKAKLNFAELYAALGFRGYKEHYLALTGIDTSQSELTYIAQAIQRGRPTPQTANGYSPYTCDVGEIMIFKTIVQLNSDQTGASTITRWYRMHRGVESIGGTGLPGGGVVIGFIPLSSSEVSGAGQLTTNAETNEDLYINLGDIGAQEVEDVFNDGQPAPNDGEAWVIDGERFITATQNGEDRIWRFILNGGVYGNWGGDDAPTDPETYLATADNFDLLSNNGQPLNEDIKIVVEKNEDFDLKLQNSGTIYEVGDNGGNAVEIHVPADGEYDNGADDPVTGTYFDFFQKSAAATPVFDLSAGVVVLSEDGDSLVFTGVNSGVRLIKISPDVWRISRITRYGSPFREVGTGSLLMNPDSDKYTNGKTGFNEQNPAHLLDAKGDQKITYTAANGAKVISHTGNAHLSDIGVPLNSIIGKAMEVRSHPDYPAGQMYVFAGDSFGLNGFKFISGFGVRDLTPGSLNEARLIAYAQNGNPLEKFAQIRAINTAGYFAGMTAINGADVEDPYTWYYANKVGKSSVMYHTPYGFEVTTGRFHLKEYGGAFPFVEGYDHGDGNTIGKAKRGLAVDDNGMVQTVFVNKGFFMDADLFLDDGYGNFTDAPGVQFDCKAGFAYKIEVVGSFLNVLSANGMAYGFRLSSGTGNINGTARTTSDVNESSLIQGKPITVIGSDNSDDRSLAQRVGFSQDAETYPFGGDFVFNCLTDGVFCLTLASESTLNGGTFKAGTGIIVNTIM